MNSSIATAESPLDFGVPWAALRLADAEKALQSGRHLQSLSQLDGLFRALPKDGSGMWRARASAKMARNHVRMGDLLQAEQAIDAIVPSILHDCPDVAVDVYMVRGHIWRSRAHKFWKASQPAAATSAVDQARHHFMAAQTVASAAEMEVEHLQGRQNLLYVDGLEAAIAGTLRSEGLKLAMDAIVAESEIRNLVVPSAREDSAGLTIAADLARGASLSCEELAGGAKSPEELAAVDAVLGPKPVSWTEALIESVRRSAGRHGSNSKALIVGVAMIENADCIFSPELARAYLVHLYDALCGLQVETQRETDQTRKVRAAMGRLEAFAGVGFRGRREFR